MFKTTPDLSKHFFPQPKPNKKEKKPLKPLQAGKKTIEWEKEREILKEEFTQQGIKTCELQMIDCTRNNFLGFAHIDKRRNLTREDLPSVILACNNCHMKVESYNRIRMGKIIGGIIKNRKI